MGNEKSLSEVTGGSVGHAALLTKFSHHGPSAGYKQLIRYTNPAFVCGIDETLGDLNAGGTALHRKYKWLYEFRVAWKARVARLSLIHLLYAEEYFRFSCHLPSKAKVVATFHQPPAVLERELERGDKSGRLYRLSHLMTKSRFRKIDGVIAITEDQREILKKYVAADKIACIPLGCYSRQMIEESSRKQGTIDSNLILTVGNWQRDWALYFRVVDFCLANRPQYRFVLVNRRVSADVMEQIAKRANVTLKLDVTDSELSDLYCSSCLQFMPLRAVAGSNAVNESLSYGCPVVSNCRIDLGNEVELAVQGALGDDPSLLVDTMDKLRGEIMNDRRKLVESCHRIALNHDWSEVAHRTLDFYRSIVG